MNIDKDQIEKEYMNLVSNGSIKEKDPNVSRRIGLMFGKAQNNLKHATTTFEISNNKSIKNTLKLREQDTFYDWTIQASYYTMFHAVNALLATKKIKISSNVHMSTYYAFGKNFINTHELADDLFVMYGETEEKALELFSSLSEEKKKRGYAAYERLPKMNIEPAGESIKNARELLSVIGDILAKNKFI
ncbi:HEPN domain-containing protein [Candidatus Woesearchaeota archaeon]|nr:HEPN domain-containing protein [Candidatus Woesearchaeota archaeon]